MTDVDRAAAHADEVLQRVRENRLSGAGRGARRRKEAEVLRRISRIAFADAVIIIAAITIGWFMPLGIGGAMIVMALLAVTTLFFAVLPGAREPSIERLAQTPLKALPLQTEQWLDRQRPALPAPAITLVDQIGLRLETLTPQLMTLDEGAPAAAEIRKLIGEQLPELVKGYSGVPEPLRRVERNGRSPDQQLVEGLRVIESEIGDMTEALAKGALDSLATRERFLQIRYQGDDAAG